MTMSGAGCYSDGSEPGSEGSEEEALPGNVTSPRCSASDLEKITE